MGLETKFDLGLREKNSDNSDIRDFKDLIKNVGIKLDEPNTCTIGNFQRPESNEVKMINPKYFLSIVYYYV